MTDRLTVERLADIRRAHKFCGDDENVTCEVPSLLDHIDALGDDLDALTAAASEAAILEYDPSRTDAENRILYAKAEALRAVLARLEGQKP